MIEHFEQRNGSDKDGQWRLDKLKGDCQTNPSVIAYCSWPINFKRADATGHPLFLFIYILIFFSHVICSLIILLSGSAPLLSTISNNYFHPSSVVTSCSITCSRRLVKHNRAKLIPHQTTTA